MQGEEQEGKVGLRTHPDAFVGVTDDANLHKKKKEEEKEQKPEKKHDGQRETVHIPHTNLGRC